MSAVRTGQRGELLSINYGALAKAKLVRHPAQYAFAASVLPGMSLLQKAVKAPAKTEPKFAKKIDSTKPATSWAAWLCENAGDP